MDELLSQFVADPAGRLALHVFASAGFGKVVLQLLVGARLIGLFLVAPLFSSFAISWKVRLGLVLFLSLIIASSLSTAVKDNQVVQVRSNAASTVDFQATLFESPADLASGVVAEVVLGTLFGVGLIAVLNGLKLAGEWLDRHCGLGLGAVYDPGWFSGGGVGTAMAEWLGVAGLLLTESVGGRWPLLQSLLQSFHTIPIGTTDWTGSSVDFLRGVVQQSLLLGIRIAMPLVATMLLVDVTLAIAQRGGTSAESSSGLTMRLAAGMIVLAFTITSLPQVVSQTLIAVTNLVIG